MDHGKKTPSGRPLEFAGGEKEETKHLDKKMRQYHVKTKSLSELERNTSSLCSSRTANGVYLNIGNSIPSHSGNNWEHQVMIIGTKNSPPGTTSRNPKSR